MEICDDAEMGAVATGVVESGCSAIFGTGNIANSVADKVVKLNGGAVANG